MKLTFTSSILTSIALLTLGLSSPTFGSESTPIAQINGEDVTLSTDTVIRFRECDAVDFRCRLYWADFSYILLFDNDVAQRVTVFDEGDVEKVCNIFADADNPPIDVSIVGGEVVTCE